MVDHSGDVRRRADVDLHPTLELEKLEKGTMDHPSFLTEKKMELKMERRIAKLLSLGIFLSPGIHELN